MERKYGKRQKYSLTGKSVCWGLTECDRVHGAGGEGFGWGGRGGSRVGRGKGNMWMGCW